VKVSAGKRGLVINGMEFATSADDLSPRAAPDAPSHAVH
jgi:hypothetical protein